jgi:Tfp pilus assembly protein PilF
MKYILFSSLFLLTNLLFAQNKEKADKLVGIGIPYHDKGDYEGAIKRYDSALMLDKDNLLALTEKAYSLMAMEKYDESIDCCKKAIKKHPNEEPLKMLYVTYGSDYDYQKKTDKSIEVYAEGIKSFPDFYLLYFNKGITLQSVKRYAEAEACYQKALLLNPYHAGAHNAVGRLLYIENKEIPSLMAFCRLLILEPRSGRAKDDFTYLQEIMEGNVEKDSTDGGVTIHVDANSLNDSIKTENNFSMVELTLSMGATLPLDSLNPSKINNFSYRLQAVCSEMKELKSKNSGYYWDYYAPYFIEMKEKNYIETFSHIAFAGTDSKENNEWLSSHKKDIDDFYSWSKAFSWKKN